MDKDEVATAIAEARRFIAAAERWSKRYETEPGIAFGSRDGGAMRRASLDLSAALSQMRKPYSRREKVTP